MRRVQAEARHLVHEARRILKKKRYRIPESVIQEVEKAAGEVESALEADHGDGEALREGLNRLDEKMDEHLSFARKSSTREYAESIGVAVAIALLLRAFVVEAFQIPSGSMIPTLEVGDHIFVSKFAYGIGIPFTHKKVFQYADPKRGDVIVFRYPPDPSIDYIKRVVGLPGEYVEIRDDEIFVNGKAVQRELVGQRSCDGGPVEEGGSRCEMWIEQLADEPHQLFQQGGGQDFPRTRVPEGEVFVMGDNRDNSKDSRFWGTVPLSLIKGRALVVWWSRDPSYGAWSPQGVKEFFGSIRWNRFLHKVD